MTLAIVLRVIIGLAARIKSDFSIVMSGSIRHSSRQAAILQIGPQISNADSGRKSRPRAGCNGSVGSYPLLPRERKETSLQLCRSLIIQGRDINTSVSSIV